MCRGRLAQRRPKCTLLRARRFTAPPPLSRSPDAVSLEHFLAAFARQPLRDIPLEHDLDAIMCGEFVACIYEMLGLLPLRRADVTALPPPPSLSSSAPSPAAASRSRSGSVSGGDAFAGGASGGAGTRLSLPRVAPDAGGAAAASANRRSSLASSVDSHGRPPRPPPHDDLLSSPPEASARGPGAPLPPLLSAGGGGRGRGGGGTLVVVDASAADFRHFTPTSFSTLHRPRLQLLRGRLEPEELLDVSEEAEAAHEARKAASAAAVAAARGGGDSSVRAAQLLTAGTALADPAARPATATTRAASRAAAAAAAGESDREWGGGGGRRGGTPPSACAPHLGDRAASPPAPQSRWLPPLLITEAGKGDAALAPAPLPTVSVLMRGGSAQPSGWGESCGGAASVAIDVARGGPSARGPPPAGGSWR